MDKKQATEIFEALSSGVRLDIFRLLVKYNPHGLVAGEIASHLDIPSSNLSFHLKSLTHATLITVIQEGRFQRYKADMAVMADTISYLTSECCSGNDKSCKSDKIIKT